MRGLAWFLMLFYFVVTSFWIANSQFLFSAWGLIIWLISILLGFIAYKQIKGKTIVVRKLMLYSTSFMVFLLILTGLIHLAVTSMP
jgi:hypothetical protein